MTDLVPVRTLDEATRAVRLAEVFIASRRRDNTRDAYRRDLLTAPSGWLPWCAAQSVDPFAARRAHVQMWLRHLEELGDADGTRARRLSTVSSFYGWLITEEIVDRNPATLKPEERPKPRTPGTAGVALSVRQAGALLAAADRDSKRAAALVALLLFTGMRVSEVADATMDDLGQDRGHRMLTVIGKGRKHRLVPLAPPVTDRLDAYLASRTDQPSRLPTKAGHGSQPRHLFVTATGRRLERSYISRMLHRLAVQAGVADKLTPHDMRRTFITASLDAGVALRDVQDAVGHADPRTTRGYDRSGLDPNRHPAYRLAGIVQPVHLEERHATA